MSNRTFVRIEYNEVEGELHIEQNLKNEQGNNGYKTISDTVDSDTASDFGYFIDEKYPSLGDREINQNPPFDQIKSDFQSFVVNRDSNLR